MEILKRSTPENIAAMSYESRYCFDVQQKITQDFVSVLESNEAINSHMKTDIFNMASLGAATNLYGIVRFKA